MGPIHGNQATILTPDQLNVPADKFEAQFGLSWTDALATGRVMNAMDGCKALELDADGLDAEWGKAKKAKKLVKFGGGFYCGLIEIDGILNLGLGLKPSQACRS